MRVIQFQGAVNQFVINDGKGNEYFQSYQSIIVKTDANGKVTLGQNWAYSVTTGRYRNLYLGETKAETQKKIDSGEYKIDMNL